MAITGQPGSPKWSAVMNLRSEIEFYSELRLLDKARLLNLFLHELAEEARGTYGPGMDQVHDTAHLRFVNELTHRLTRVIEQLLAEEATRPADDIVLRMLLSPRADKVAERLVYNAYSRAIQGFESYDTTVLMSS
jgi:exoribonuclease II